MFVPVMSKCGHNFCYECITSWLISNDGGATSPACREEIVEPPYFNLQIQELCNQLVPTVGKLREGGVPELITTSRENKLKKYKRDLKTKKLYNNVFKNSAYAVIDKSDGVARCRNCHCCNTRFRNPNRIQEEFQDSDIDSDDRHHVVRYVNGNNDEDDDENSDTQPNSDDADFIDDRPINNLDIYNENSDYSSSGSSPARQTSHYQSGLVEIVNRGGRRNVIPGTDSEEEQSDRDAPDYESWNGIHPSSSSRGGSASYQRNVDIVPLMDIAQSGHTMGNTKRRCIKAKIMPRSQSKLNFEDPLSPLPLLPLRLQINDYNHFSTPLHTPSLYFRNYF